MRFYYLLTATTRDDSGCDDDLFYNGGQEGSLITGYQWPDGLTVLYSYLALSNVRFYLTGC